MTDSITIVSTISEGTYFRILKARRNTKFIILKVATHPDSMTSQLLRREYEIGVTLSAPQIVNTLGFEENTPVGAAVVLEYIEGKTLSDEEVPRKLRNRILNDILDGAEYLHHRGIIHNDLKPSNIIINSNGNARIIDFGLSISDDSIYRGCIGGSYGFSAPEILKGEGPVGAASDIFSIGCLIRHIYGSKQLRAIAEKCTRYEPSKRYQSIFELRKAITRKRIILPLACAITAILIAILIAILPTFVHKTAQIKTLTLEERYHSLLDSQFYQAVEHMSGQKYRELADMVYEHEYSRKVLYPFMDSLNRNFPMSKTGEISPEIYAICAVNKEHQTILDSLLTSLPTLRTLPWSEQKALKQSLKKELSGN